jgi:hypothetical protein
LAVVVAAMLKLLLQSQQINLLQLAVVRFMDKFSPLIQFLRELLLVVADKLSQRMALVTVK